MWRGFTSIQEALDEEVAGETPSSVMAAIDSSALGVGDIDEHGLDRDYEPAGTLEDLEAYRKDGVWLDRFVDGLYRENVVDEMHWMDDEMDVNSVISDLEDDAEFKEMIQEGLQAIHQAGRDFQPQPEIFQSTHGAEEDVDVHEDDYVPMDDPLAFGGRRTSASTLDEDEVDFREASLEDAAARWQERVERQIDLETLALRNTIEEYREIFHNVMKIGKGASLGPAQRLLVRWFKPLTERIEQEQMLVWRRVPADDRTAYGPFLILLPPEQLAVITMHEVVNMILRNGGSARLVHVGISVGEQLQNEVNMMKVKKQDRELWNRLRQATTKATQYQLRRRLQQLLSQSEWPKGSTVKVHYILPASTFYALWLFFADPPLHWLRLF